MRGWSEGLQDSGNRGKGIGRAMNKRLISGLAACLALAAVICTSACSMVIPNVQQEAPADPPQAQYRQFQSDRVFRVLSHVPEASIHSFTRSD
jgi:hypothetical protein